jgi:alpha-glucuronidase
LAKTDLGLLYGSYHLLNLQQQKANFSNLKLEEKPSYDVRILNHWDNLDGTIERGYAGHSLWKWEDLPIKFRRDTKNMQEPMHPSESTQRF